MTFTRVYILKYISHYPWGGGGIREKKWGPCKRKGRKGKEKEEIRKKKRK
jgi:hypothetical protein